MQIVSWCSINSLVLVFVSVWILTCLNVHIHEPVLTTLSDCCCYSPYVEGVLTKHDFPRLHNRLITVAYQTFSIGTQLGLHVGTVKSLRADCPQDTTRFLGLVLSKWLERADPPPTVQELVDVLSSRVIDNKALAFEVLHDYGLS